MQILLDDLPLPEDKGDAELEALFGLNDGLPGAAPLAALNYEMLERGAVQEALNNEIKHAGRIVMGLRGFFSAKHEAALRSLVDKTPDELADLIEQGAALERAQQIAGVFLCELLYTARILIAQQLLRELDTDGARAVAEMLDTLIPEDYCNACPDDL